MFVIRCPYCGERDVSDFAYGGEAHIARPSRPDDLGDQQWADYLYMRTNSKGVHFERWRHIHGCARFFNCVRDTVSDRILETYPIGASAPGAAG